MTEAQNEKNFAYYKELISCLSDGELSALETQDLLQALPKFPELRSYWFRLQVKNKVLKNNVLEQQTFVVSENLQWASQVTQVLEQEANQETNQEINQQEVNIVSFSKAKQKTTVKERFSTLTHFAVAASVMLMVTGIWLGTQTEFRQVALAYFSVQTPEPLNNEFVIDQTIQANDKVLVSSGNLSSETSESVNDLFLSENRIEQYMLLHAENASLNTNHGMLPFARMHKVSGKQF